MVDRPRKARKKRPKVRASERASKLDPRTAQADADHGAETERNYRYQHTYGVILLVAARRGLKPYTAIYCEHHEDLLAARLDGFFDAIQIKTSRPELGAWTMIDPALINAIGHFFDLAKTIEQMGDFYFISNTEFDEVTAESTDDRRRGRCPKLFLSHIRGCSTLADVTAPFDRTLVDLAAGCGCSQEQLFPILKRIELVLGPPRDGIDALVAHEHLPKLPECEKLPPVDLDKIRDHLVAQVWRAASLSVRDPIRHIRSLTRPEGADPVVESKRIYVRDLTFDPSGVSPATFAFVGPALLKVGSTDLTVARQKFERGEIDEEQIETMEDRGRAAEALLIEDAHRQPERYPALLRQLESAVLGECRESYLRFSQGDDAFGTKMLIDVQDRLRKLANERPHMIGGQEYECLVGIATMLTGECRVWWSKRFQLEPDQDTNSHGVAQ